jgi:hypothetical protein
VLQRTNSLLMCSQARFSNAAKPSGPLAGAAHRGAPNERVLATLLERARPLDKARRASAPFPASTPFLSNTFRCWARPGPWPLSSGAGRRKLNPGRFHTTPRAARCHNVPIAPDRRHSHREGSVKSPSRRPVGMSLAACVLLVPCPFPQSDNASAADPSTLLASQRLQLRTLRAEGGLTARL